MDHADASAKNALDIVCALLGAPSQRWYRELPNGGVSVAEGLLIDAKDLPALVEAVSARSDLTRGWSPGGKAKLRELMGPGRLVRAMVLSNPGGNGGAVVSAMGRVVWSTSPQRADQLDWTADAMLYGPGLNEACWAFRAACTETSPALYESTRPALRAAILAYARAISADAPEHAETPAAGHD